MDRKVCNCYRAFHHSSSLAIARNRQSAFLFLLELIKTNVCRSYCSQRRSLLVVNALDEYSLRTDEMYVCV